MTHMLVRPLTIAIAVVLIMFDIHGARLTGAAEEVSAPTPNPATPQLSNDAAVTAARKYMASEGKDTESYNVTVSQRGADYYVLFDPKNEYILGGVVGVLVDGRSGAILKTHWYQ